MLATHLAYQLTLKPIRLNCYTIYTTVFYITKNIYDVNVNATGVF